MAHLHRKLKRFRNRHIKFSSPTLTANDWADAPNGHMSCVECGCPFFHVDIDPANEQFLTACSKCHTEAKISLKGIMNSSFPDKGQCQCECGSNKWVLIRNNRYGGIGCKSCPFQLFFKLDIRGGIITDISGNVLH